MSDNNIKSLEGEIVYIFYKYPLGNITANAKCRGIVYQGNYYEISLNNNNSSGEVFSLKPIDEKKITRKEVINPDKRTLIEDTLLKSLREGRKTLELTLPITFNEG